MRCEFLITGSSGFVGSYLKKKLRNSVNIYNETELDKNNIKCDLTNSRETFELINKYKPLNIFHLAGKVDPSKNEDDKVDAYNKNYITTLNIINTIKKLDLNCHIIFLSTDKVYDEINTYPSEEDNLSDQYFYAKLKIKSENLIIKNVRKYHILRVPIIHSFGDYNSSSFIDKSIINIRNNINIHVYENIYRSFVDVNDLTEIMVQIINKDKYGIYNVGSSKYSYYERLIYLFNLYNKKNYINFIKPDRGSINPIDLSLNTTKIMKNYNMIFK